MKDAENKLDEIATAFGTSCTTLWRRLKEYNVSTSKGIGRGSHIAGCSTRNQRIERLCRNLYRCVASTYNALFHAMEAVEVLDPDDEVNLFVLHCLYLPRINNSIEEFCKALKKHPLRIEHCWSPYKIWTNSVLRDEIDHEIPDLDSFGLDQEGPIADEQTNTVVVPETFESLSEGIKDTFLQQLYQVTSNIGNIDAIVEFLEVKALLNDLPEASSDSNSE
uniref:Integrase core domain-containing protein n=1 Tax=Amphimedon queenslandica TaxID=400682 RepID=A0A1X7VWR9_AMPQE